MIWILTCLLAGRHTHWRVDWLRIKNVELQRYKIYLKGVYGSTVCEEWGRSWMKADIWKGQVQVTNQQMARRHYITWRDKRSCETQERNQQKNSSESRRLQKWSNLHGIKNHLKLFFKPTAATSEKKDWSFILSIKILQSHWAPETLICVWMRGIRSTAATWTKCKYVINVLLG